MSMTTEELYNLLPAIYRMRDADNDGALQDLISVLATQASVMETDIADLYDNWFIETCAEWVIPYIGDVLGVQGLHPFGSEATFSQRARVANTIGYRRRKGTATMLEQLAHDTTGWNARVVGFFELLETTQYYNHPRLHSHRTPDLRDTNRLELLDTAFDTITHSADVRHISSGRGRHNISNIGIFLWRLQSYFIPESEARAIVSEGAGRYTFHPFGIDAPLFNRPQTETEITHLAEEVNVPGPLRRRPLFDELESRRQAKAEGRDPVYIYFDDRAEAGNPPVFEVLLDGVAVSPDEVMICDLSDWHTPASSKSYQVPVDGGSPVAVVLPITAAVDPVLGRLTLPTTVTPSDVRVSYAYGFPGDVGGGPYNRAESMAVALEKHVTWQVGVGKDVTPGPQLCNSLTDAVTQWNAQPAGTVGLIAILDNSSYEENLNASNKIQIPEKSQLSIVAATWPDQPTIGSVDADERRAHIIGDISIVGTAPDSSETPGDLILDGIHVEGNISVLVGNLGDFRLAHCTLLSGVAVNIPESEDSLKHNSGLCIQVDHSITGPLQMSKKISGLRILDSLVFATDDAEHYSIFSTKTETKPYGPTTVIERSTILGKIYVEALELASEALFMDVAKVEKVQTGCMRFTYNTPGSTTPKRYRSQPDLALEEYADRLGFTSVSSLSSSQVDGVERRLVPGFTSLDTGNPACAQLHRNCAAEIQTGAEDGSEIGVWCFLKQPLRSKNLIVSLDEYLRFGLEAGLIFVT